MTGVVVNDDFHEMCLVPGCMKDNDPGGSRSLTSLLVESMNRRYANTWDSTECDVSSAGVKTFVDGLQTLAVHMGVDLCGGDVRMSQQFLNHTQIRPSFQQVGCE